MEQKIWYKHELPIFEELLSYRDGLIKDFMANHASLTDAIFAQSENTVSPANYNNTAMDQAG